MEHSPTESPRDLVRSELFDELVERVMKGEGHDRDLAERIMDQTLVFLVACGQNPKANLAPSNITDPGWHAFILYTRDYAAFCERIAGRFIHHQPMMNDDIRSGTALARTLEALRKTGYPVDESLWPQSPTCMNTCNHACSDSDTDDGK